LTGPTQQGEKLGPFAAAVVADDGPTLKMFIGRWHG
jgi:hypothetical protein